MKKDFTSNTEYCTGDVLISNIETEFFKEGHEYYIIDDGVSEYPFYPGADREYVSVYDEQGEVHILTNDYIKENFEMK